MYNRYRGKQPILERQKEVRPEIVHNTVVNYANEIVSFKTSYLLGEPMQYVSAGDNEGAGVPENVNKLNRLNGYMRQVCKAARDKELADWVHICGVGYRLVLPNGRMTDDDDTPFNVFTLDPRLTFLVQYGGVDHHTVLACNIVPRENMPSLLCMYAQREDGIYYCEAEYNGILPASYPADGTPKALQGPQPEMKTEPVYLDLPEVPIIEYTGNNARMGAFEVVNGILDEINLLTSTRAEAVDQFVQSLWVFQNCKISNEQFRDAAAGKAIQITSEGSNGQESKVYAVTVDLNQNGVQAAVDDARNAMLDICGMPATQNGSASTSDTGSAVIMRDGWQQAEARAKDTETLFKEAEMQFLKNVLYICRHVAGLDIKPRDVEMKFNRRNYADLLTRVQSLTTMLGSDKIAPQLAFEHCGLFTDPEAAFTISTRYREEQEAKTTQPVQEETPAAVPETQQEAIA